MITDVFADLRQKLRDFTVLKMPPEAQKKPEPADSPVFVSFFVDGQWWEGWYSRKKDAIQAIRARVDEIEQTGVDERQELKACVIALDRLDPQIR